MSVRVRQTAGVSWASQPGVRQWRSASVSYGPVELVCWLLGLALVFPLWLEIEVVVMFLSVLVVMAAWICQPDPAHSTFHVELARWGWFRYLRCAP